MKTQTMMRSIAASLLVAALAPSTAWAAQGFVQGKVFRTLLDSSLYGGCMAALSASPSVPLPNCSPWWVSFACNSSDPAAVVDPVVGYRMMDQAQLAFVTQKDVFLVVDDSRIFNGYCVATRIDVIQ